MNLRRNSEKKRLEEDNGLISQKLTVRPAWTVNNLIITDLMPLGLTEIEKATLGWGAVNQVCAARRIISTLVHAKATSDDRYKFKWQLKGTLRRSHIWLTFPSKWLKNVTLNAPHRLFVASSISEAFSARGASSSGETRSDWSSLTLCARLIPDLWSDRVKPPFPGGFWCENNDAGGSRLCVWEKTLRQT